MRQTNKLNQIWFTNDKGRVQIGFTRSFLDSLDECWNILPAHTKKFKAKAPLLTVETNDALISIMSPVTGTLYNYDTKMRDFPDQLTEESIIMELRSDNLEGEKPVIDVHPIDAILQAHGLNRPAPVAPPRGAYANVQWQVNIPIPDNGMEF